MDRVFEALTNATLITGLVMIMMALIEFINVSSAGGLLIRLQNSRKRQIFVSTLLGLIPGCIGGFAVVSLYTRRVVSFGALIAMMIASSGDEAFIMLALIPKTVLWLFPLLFVIAITSGLIVDHIGIRREPEEEVKEGCCTSHSGDSYPLFSSTIRENFKKVERKRLLIMGGIILFIMAIASGLLNHEHLPDDMVGEGHSHHHFNIFDEQWINILFAILGGVILLFTVKASDHFIKHHLWDHVVKKHLLSIFLWTFGALLIIHLFIGDISADHTLLSNGYLLIIAAVTIGLIPESGPHMIFITLYASGLIPPSILIASSISQDGHTALPLLAHNKISFAKAKLINLVIGALVGSLLYTFGL